MPYTTDLIESTATSHFTGALGPGVIENASLDFPEGWSGPQFQKIMLTV